MTVNAMNMLERARQKSALVEALKPDDIKLEDVIRKIQPGSAEFERVYRVTIKDYVQETLMHDACTSDSSAALDNAIESYIDFMMMREKALEAARQYEIDSVEHWQDQLTEAKAA